MVSCELLMVSCELVLHVMPERAVHEPLPTQVCRGLFSSYGRMSMLCM